MALPPGAGMLSGTVELEYRMQCFHLNTPAVARATGVGNDETMAQIMTTFVADASAIRRRSDISGAIRAIFVRFGLLVVVSIVISVVVSVALQSTGRSAGAGGGVVGGVAGAYVARELVAIQKAYEMLVLEMLAARLESEGPRLAARGIRVIGISANFPSDWQRLCGFDHFPGPHILLSHAEVPPEPPLGTEEVAVNVADDSTVLTASADGDIARRGLLEPPTL